MKTERTHFRSRIQSLALFAILTCVVGAGEQTNTVRSIVLPPENWDAKAHVLATLVTTNTPGIYSLPTKWSGEERTATNSGWFKWYIKNFPETNDWFVAAKFQVHEDSRLYRRLGTRHLWLDDDGTPAASYRPSLPSDADLLGMTNITLVSNLFGWNPFLISTNTESGRMRFFTLRPYDTIELLQVGFKLREDKSDIVDSVFVRRGKLYPQQRKQ